MVICLRHQTLSKRWIWSRAQILLLDIWIYCASAIASCWTLGSCGLEENISFLAMITKPDCTICSRPDSQKNHPQDKFSRQTLRGAISSEHLLQTGFTRSCSAARSTLYFQKYFPKHLCSRYCRRISHDFFNKCIFKSTTTQTNFTDNCSASCSWIHTENTVRCNWRFRPIDNSGIHVHTEHTARCNTHRTLLGATEGFVQLTIVGTKCTQNTQLGATESGEIRRSLELHFIQQSIKVLETIKTFTLLYI